MPARQQGNVVALVVQDSGVGIAPEALAHVFDRFYRGDPARSQQDSESGPGLAIAKSIVEAHGGRIAAQSAVGQETTFTVLMPSVKSTGAAHSAGAAQPAATD